MVLVSKTNRVRAVREMAKKICNICNTRPVDKNAGIQDACVPCYEEGGWENAHSDGAHDSLTKLAEDAKTAGAVELRKLAPKAGIKNAGQHKSAELRVMILKAIEEEQAGCWICFPELNEAQMEPKVRATGERASRKGQIINVPLRAPGEIKAGVVVKAAPAATVHVAKNGSATLNLEIGGLKLRLAWDAEGCYDYMASSATIMGKSRKVRNVAEALRLIRQ